MEKNKKGLAVLGAAVFLALATAVGVFIRKV